MAGFGCGEGAGLDVEFVFDDISEPRFDIRDLRTGQVNTNVTSPSR
jgi:hypothetical protein